MKQSLSRIRDRLNKTEYKAKILYNKYKYIKLTALIDANTK